MSPATWISTPDLHEDCGVFERLTKLDEEFPGANILLHKTGKLPEVIIMIHF